MSDTAKHGSIVFVYVDQRANAFVQLAAATWDEPEAQQRFDALPRAQREGPLLADYYDHTDSIVNTISITRAAVEAAAGEPLPKLLRRGRAQLREQTETLRAILGEKYAASQEAQ